jgi:Cof subfamily protein (haloacid dehalogenase superfamily)
MVMTTPDIRFIAADMDGTLLDPSGNLDPDFFDVFEQLTERNVLFAAASGRQYYSLQDTFAPIADKMLFVAENGTMVMHQGQELYSNTIERQDITRVIEVARQIDGVHIVLCGKSGAYIESTDPNAHQEIQKYYAKRTQVDDLLSVDDQFIKVALLHFGGTEAKVAPTFSAEFGESHQVVVSAKIWLDVMDKAASKGAAIEHLQNTMGFSYEQTMSFGDFFNDVEMLQVSGESYAMENAHPEVKQYAKYIAPSNAQSGVLSTIKRLFSLSQ